mgnify:CR=1 FL=1
MLNQKGGVGKTTTTVNVGGALAQAGKRVLLIDLDPQGHLSLHVGIDPGELDKSLYDLLADDDTRADEIIHEVTPNLGVLPAEVNLAGVESELADRVRTGEAQQVLRTKCASLVGNFDFVFLDCPPSLGLLSINALALAGEVIVPMQAHFLALQGLSKLLETVQIVRRSINPQLTVAGVVLAMHEANTVLAGEVVADLQAFLDAARDQDVPWRDAVVFQPPIRRNIKLAESPSFGQTIFDYAPYCPGARDYEALAAHIASKR